MRKIENEEEDIYPAVFACVWQSFKRLQMMPVAMCQKHEYKYQCIRLDIHFSSTICANYDFNNALIITVINGLVVPIQRNGNERNKSEINIFDRKNRLIEIAANQLIEPEGHT